MQKLPFWSAALLDEAYAAHVATEEALDAEAVAAAAAKWEQAWAEQEAAAAEQARRVLAQAEEKARQAEAEEELDRQEREERTEHFKRCLKYFSKKLLRALFFSRTSVRDSGSSARDGAAEFWVASKFSLFQ